LKLEANSLLYIESRPTSANLSETQIMQFKNCNDFDVLECF